ncbi:MAG: nucleoside transporter C-terminal domain-containing protein [Synechococcales bacterium]|nr:nucleoside transporter C-terminal domain-containing protein [Synechococcales bacterium]
MLNLLSFVGLFGLCGIAWLGSEDRRTIPWKVIAWGIGLQLILGALIFLVPLTRDLVLLFNDGLNAVIDASEAGARFLFSPLFVPQPGPTAGPVLAGRWIARAITPPYTPIPGDRLGPGQLDLGYIFAFRALPQVIFFSAIVSLLYNLGIIQPIVSVFAKIFRRTMNISGAESLAGAANIFVGIESVLAVKPFLESLTRSELCAILTSCFGSIASTVLALYAGFLRPTFPAITGHLMSASILTIPACFIMAKLVVPEREVPKTLGVIPNVTEDAEERQSPMDSLILGALDGVKLAVGIAAVIVAILGLVALLNLVFANLANLADSPNVLLRPIGQLFSVITLENILGALFLPLTFLTGVSLEWTELWQASMIIGRRLLETAVPPYRTLATLAAAGEVSDRTMLIVSYVLCGFAHIPSVGIFAGGLAALVPSRRKDISAVVWKALWAATLATLMTGCIAGVFDLGNPTVLGR